MRARSADNNMGSCFKKEMTTLLGWNVDKVKEIKEENCVTRVTREEHATLPAFLGPVPRPPRYQLVCGGVYTVGQALIYLEPELELLDSKYIFGARARAFKQ